MDEGDGAMPFVLGEENVDGEPFSHFSLKRKAKAKKHEFVSWGSKPLIEFLQSIGKDTAQMISKYDVTDIINRYVSANSLLHPTKKRRIVCDERLLSVFGKKTIAKNKIFELLAAHFAQDQESDDELLFSLEEEEEKNACEDKKFSKARQEKKVVDKPKSSFAAIIPDNIKLVYLKKSLVEEFLKDLESFEAKVVGSFVRIKSDPFDYRQQQRYQLVLVRGLKKASGTVDASSNILLQVSNYRNDVSISMLSNDNFSEEECEDLHERVKLGLLKRLTLVELEEKVHILHHDLTKHWLAGELVRLEKFINRANEKGWRREMFEYMDRRQLLQTPDEQARLLHEIPNVTPEDIEPEAAAQDIPNDKHGNDGQLVSTPVENSKNPSHDTEVNGSLASSMHLTKDSIAAPPAQDIPNEKYGNDSPPVSTALGNSKIPRHETEVNGILSSLIPPTKDSIENWHDVQKLPRQPRFTMCENVQLVNLEEKEGNKEEKKASGSALGIQVIELSDDDDDKEQEDPKGKAQRHGGNNDNSAEITRLVWHYIDPQGDTRGPFSLSELKYWNEAHFFPEGFKVWKTGQSPESSVSLTEILNLMFPK